MTEREISLKNILEGNHALNRNGEFRFANMGSFLKIEIGLTA
jgi:hypothetical protein